MNHHQNEAKVLREECDTIRDRLTYQEAKLVELRVRCQGHDGAVQEIEHSLCRLEEQRLLELEERKRLEGGVKSRDQLVVDCKDSF